MYSIKQGRGESWMGVVGGLGAAAVGMLWTMLTWNIGAPHAFSGFGLIFVFIGLASAAYNFFNAESPTRLSEMDVVSGEEEPDPLNQRAAARAAGGRVCRPCGAAVEPGDRFCPRCGKSISVAA